MQQHTGPNPLTNQEVDDIFGDVLAIADDVESGKYAEDKSAEAALIAERRAQQLEELRRYEAREALRKAAADKASAERAAERVALNEVIGTALAPLSARPGGLTPALQASMARWLTQFRAAPADKKFPLDDDAADETFPDLGEAGEAATPPGRTTHYVSEAKEAIFFSELRRRSAGGHPFRDARDPLTGKSASVLLRTPSADASFAPSAADRKFPTHPFKAPPPWRDLSPKARAIYGIEAAKIGGRAKAITIGLGDIIKAKAPAAKHGALRYIVKAIDRQLKSAFGSTPPLFVTLEDAGDIGLHLHGIVELSDHQVGKVAKAIRKAVGEWREHADKQVDIQPIFSRGWGTYMTKDSAFMRAATGRRGYYMSHDLRRRAEETHKSDCDFIKMTGGLERNVSQI